RARGNDAVWALVRMVPDSMGHPSVPLLGETGEFVASFSGPAAIVWGTKDPVLGRLMRRHHRLLPDAFVTETDAGHFLQEEVPADIAQAIRAVAAG
ncbi:MAG: haloalkane dehalogenase, partial [Acidimicrobiia bacterium]|nr:haloalkane dehalogenase [Acidimicrobiia bacterium]